MRKHFDGDVAVLVRNSEPDKHHPRRTVDICHHWYLKYLFLILIFLVDTYLIYPETSLLISIPKMKQSVTQIFSDCKGKAIAMDGRITASLPSVRESLIGLFAENSVS